MTFDLPRRGSVIARRKHKHYEQRAKSNREIVEVDYDEDEDRYNHSQREEIHPHGIRKIIVHDVYVLGKPICDPSKGSSIEETHRRSQYSCHGTLQHHLAAPRPKDGQ